MSGDAPAVPPKQHTISSVHHQDVAHLRLQSVLLLGLSVVWGNVGALVSTLAVAHAAASTTILGQGPVTVQRRVDANGQPVVVTYRDLPRPDSTQSRALHLDLATTPQCFSKSPKLPCNELDRLYLLKGTVFS